MGIFGSNGPSYSNRPEVPYATPEWAVSLHVEEKLQEIHDIFSLIEEEDGFEMANLPDDEISFEVVEHFDEQLDQLYNNVTLNNQYNEETRNRLIDARQRIQELHQMFLDARQFYEIGDEDE